MFCRQGSRHGVTGRRRRWAGEANWNASRLPGGCGVRGPFFVLESMDHGSRWFDGQQAVLWNSGQEPTLPRNSSHRPSPSLAQGIQG